MFVCPNCGFRDAPCWRTCRFIRIAVYCRLDELESFDPKLTQKLRKNNDLEEGPYAYHVSKTGYVVRVVRELRPFLYDHNMWDKHQPPKDKLMVKESLEDFI
jgi:hypothetical protein